MSDRYLDFTHSSFGKSLATMLGLPTPPRLRRADLAWSAHALDGRNALVGASTGAQLAGPLLAALTGCGATLRILPGHAGLAILKAAAAHLKLNLIGDPAKEAGQGANQLLVFDASGIATAAQLRELYDFFNPVIRGLATGGRVLVLVRSGEESPQHRACAASLRGFVRSLGKEIGRRGSTANLLEVAPGGEEWLAAPMQFLLTEHAAFVSGQVLEVTPGPRNAPKVALAGSLSGKIALVTGAARGIGASIAQVLAREGAKVIGMDRPQEEGALGETMSAIAGTGLALDVTAPDAAQRIASEVERQFGGLDVVVHNAGVTRDKTLANMPPHYWDQLLDINFGAILRINEGLLKNGLRDGARMVCISSVGGIGGNAGQTNYGAAKAGIIGYADAMASTFARRGGAINAVAPGFIETQMTAAMPLVPREVGRRLNSLAQGGLPQDIAEAVAFLAAPAAGGINGRTLRVCGQSFLGA